MANAQALIFDSNWKMVRSPVLWENADPIAMTFFNNKVWMTDWSQFKIYNMDEDGNNIKEFNNIELDQAFLEKHTEASSYRSLSIFGLVIFGVVFIIGLGAAWLLEREETISKFS